MAHSGSSHLTRSWFRKLALEGAVVCGLLAICYRLAAIWVDSTPMIICLAAGAVLALIGVALPDAPVRPDVLGDYEEGRRGSVPDGRTDRP